MPVYKVKELSYPALKADVERCVKQLHAICECKHDGTVVMSVPPEPTDFDMQFSAAFDELKVYRNTGLEPEQIIGLCDMNKRSRMAKMLHWEEAEKDGRLVEQRFVPGSNIQVVERDECGEAGDVCGYMFVAQVGEYVIATAYINDAETIEETMEYHKGDTAGCFHCDLSVFPLKDCYATREEAEEALRKENEE